MLELEAGMGMQVNADGTDLAASRPFGRRPHGGTKLGKEASFAQRHRNRGKSCAGSVQAITSRVVETPSVLRAPEAVTYVFYGPSLVRADRR
jgi:hypothetical protein